MWDVQDFFEITCLIDSARFYYEHTPDIYQFTGILRSLMFRNKKDLKRYVCANCQLPTSSDERPHVFLHGRIQLFRVKAKTLYHG